MRLWKGEVVEVIRVVIQVWNGSTGSSVVALATSVREAASIVAAAYPHADVRVKFPIDPEAFFVEDPAARAEIVGFEQQDEMVA